jgi:shikimate kinase
MRCSGKTTVGGLVAERLGYAFADTDALVRERYGLTVADIVSREGWEGFRQKEKQALRSAAAPYTVVATGGGAVLCGENRSFLLETGLCAYLAAPASLLAARLLRAPETGQRPALGERAGLSPPAEDDLEREVADLLREREALYREVARYTVDAAREPAEVADAILSLAALPARRGKEGT